MGATSSDCGDGVEEKSEPRIECEDSDECLVCLPDPYPIWPIQTTDPDSDQGEHDAVAKARASPQNAPAFYDVWSFDNLKSKQASCGMTQRTGMADALACPSLKVVP